MATCTSGQLPYKVDYSGADFSGNTPAEACQKNGIAYNGYYAVLNNGTYCEVGWSGSGDGHDILTVCEVAATTPDPAASSPSGTASTSVTCTGTCTLLLQPAPADADHIADMSSVWGLFLVAAIVIACAKGILNLFNGAPHAD